MDSYIPAPKSGFTAEAPESAAKYWAAISRDVLEKISIQLRSDDQFMRSFIASIKPDANMANILATFEFVGFEPSRYLIDILVTFALRFAPEVIVPDATKIPGNLTMFLVDSKDDTGSFGMDKTLGKTWYGFNKFIQILVCWGMTRGLNLAKLHAENSEYEKIIKFYGEYIEIRSNRSRAVSKHVVTISRMMAAAPSLVLESRHVFNHKNGTIDTLQMIANKVNYAGVSTTVDAVKVPTKKKSGKEKPSPRTNEEKRKHYFTTGYPTVLYLDAAMTGFGKMIDKKHSDAHVQLMHAIWMFTAIVTNNPRVARVTRATLASAYKYSELAIKAAWSGPDEAIFVHYLPYYEQLLATIDMKEIYAAIHRAYLSTGGTDMPSYADLGFETTASDEMSAKDAEDMRDAAKSRKRTAPPPANAARNQANP